MEAPENKRIIELPKNVYDKIAAGEVVDRPLSIVKELLENAIDAGSNTIIVEIKNGGKSYIRVTDNGCGIEKDDVELAFKRHATSKIQTASDLDSITSLGFRGEALASIAAVSRTELITKTISEKSGIRVKIEGGEILEKADTGCPEGTTVIIQDLFYNTPARLKFMKPDATESTLIIDFLSKMALAYPSIKIRLINNGTILFSTSGKGDIYSNILTIYSKDVGEKLIHLQENEGEMFLEAYVSSPSQSKTNRKSQIFFVNGRSISSKLMENAISDAYAEKLFEGRHPIAFLFLQVAPDKLDVNIHPNKKEVRFDNEQKVREFLASAVRRRLNSGEAITEIKTENLFKMDRNQRKLPETASFKGSQEAVVKSGEPFVKTSKKAEAQVDIKSLLSSERQKKQPALIDSKREELFVEQKPVVKESIAKETLVKESLRKESFVNETQGKYDLENRIKGQDLGNQMECQDLGNQRKHLDQQFKEIPIKKEFDIHDITITGSIFGTYITGVDENSFYLIDQHAAHERIFYENMLEQFLSEEKQQQTILIPIVKNVSYAVKNESLEILDFLGNMGFQIEEFGPKAYIIKAIPMFMEYDEAEDFLDYIMDNVSEGTDLKNQKKIDSIITNACKKAVKAHDLLDQKEIDQLISDLAKTKNPYSCPHGRPTFIKLNKYEIEKMFKRV